MATRRGPILLDYRYIAFKDTETNQRYLIRMTENAFERIIVDKNGHSVQPQSGDIAIVEHFRKRQYTLEDGTIMLFNPKIFTVLDHLHEELTKRYTLDQMKFFGWGVVLRDANSKVTVKAEQWNQMTNLETSYLLNKLKQKLKLEEQKEAFVEITANFKVYFGWSENRKRYYANGDWRITSQNLLPLKRTKLDHDTMVKMSRFMASLKELINSKFLVSDEDLRKLLEELEIKMSIEEAREHVKNIVWKKGYDEDYFVFLKERAKQVGTGMEGFIFEFKGGITIFEEPKFGKATYVFLGKPSFIIGKIEGIRNVEANGKWRETLIKMKKDMPTETRWFIGRVIHNNFDQWTKDLEMLLGEVTK